MMKAVLVALCVAVLVALATAQCDPGEPFTQIDSTANVAFRLDPEAQADQDKDFVGPERSQPGLTNAQQLQVTIAESMGIDVDAVVVYRVTSTDAAVAICTGNIGDFLNEVNSQCLYYPSPFADTILFNARVSGVSWDASCAPLPPVEPVNNGNDDDDNGNGGDSDDGNQVSRNSVLVLTFKDSATAVTVSVAAMATMLAALII